MLKRLKSDCGVLCEMIAGGIHSTSKSPFEHAHKITFRVDTGLYEILPRV